MKTLSSGPRGSIILFDGGIWHVVTQEATDLRNIAFTHIPGLLNHILDFIEMLGEKFGKNYY